MQVTFSELQSEFLYIFNLDSSNADANQVTTAKLRINEIQDRIAFRKSYEFRKRTFYLTVRKPYSTGTTTATQNSKTVTGSGTSWDVSQRIGYLLIGSKTYKIRSIDSTTSLTLMSPFSDSTTSAASYKIVFPDYYLPSRIMSIVNVKVANRYIDVMSRDKLTLSIAATGIPTQCAIGETYFEDWYKTGTVTVTAASAVVTGSSTAWTSDMEGMDFRVDEFSKPYIIKSVDSTTQLTLLENYDGSTGSGKTYKISPIGSPVITFRDVPSDYFWVEIEALIALPKMINNNDISLIPHHAALLAGIRWMAHDLKNENPVRIEQLAAEFKKALNDLDSAYRSVDLKWISNEELQYRKNAVITNQIYPFDF